MTRFVIMLGWLACGAALAQQQAAAFMPPAAYPVERYEAGWGKNPFTLKTAPVVMTAVSFAKDLALTSIAGDTTNPTVTIVNTKTHERFRLKVGQPAENGMQIAEVKRAESRRDSVVTVTLGSETSELHYDSSYLKQMAAGASAKMQQGAPQVQQPPGLQRLPPAGQPSVRLPAMRVPPQKPVANNATASPTVPGMVSTATRGGMAPTGTLQQNLPQIAGSADVPIGADSSVGTAPAVTIDIQAPTGGAGNLTVSTGAPVTTSTPQPTQVANSNIVPDAVLVPERRRIITPLPAPQ